MVKKEKLKPNCIELKYPKKYNSFEEFYSENKPEIYKSIVDIFNEFKQTDKKILSVSINAVISGFNWDTSFDFTKDQYFIMKRDLLPYFEEHEDYEMCSKIINLDKELIS